LRALLVSEFGVLMAKRKGRCTAFSKVTCWSQVAPQRIVIFDRMRLLNQELYCGELSF
jgi:hypothetical protein